MSFDETIIHCASPALCGIKPACLFSMSQEKAFSGFERLHQWNLLFSRENKFFATVKKNGGRLLFFVYDRLFLEKLLKNEKNISYLTSKGYKVEMGLDAILSELFKRLACDSSFPHEVGLFLGYPLEDVVGFENHAAQGFKYSGIWKVYGNKKTAIRRMNLYKSCTEYCMKLLASGLSVPLATAKYCHFLEAQNESINRLCNDYRKYRTDGRFCIRGRKNRRSRSHHSNS